VLRKEFPQAGSELVRIRLDGELPVEAAARLDQIER
jgi:hypothetical protein